MKSNLAKHAPLPFIAENTIDYLSPPYEASFFDLDEILRATGRVLIGWARVGSSWNELNPVDKNEKKKWQDGDMLLAAIDPKLMGAAMNAAELLVEKVRSNREKRATKDQN